jgi:hypothetical protein
VALQQLLELRHLAGTLLESVAVAVEQVTRFATMDSMVGLAVVVATRPAQLEDLQSHHLDS